MPADHPDAHSYAHPGAHPGADSYADSYANSRAHSRADPNPHTHTHGPVPRADPGPNKPRSLTVDAVTFTNRFNSLTNTFSHYHITHFADGRTHEFRVDHSYRTICRAEPDFGRDRK